MAGERGGGGGRNGVIEFPIPTMPISFRSVLVALSACLLVPVIALAQGAPTKTPSETTAEAEATIRAGVDLHDKGQFDEAIAKYQEVLTKTPGDINALFELAYSYLSKREFDRAFDTAKKGSEYKSELLPMFYDLMASSLDSKGQPQQAVDMYKKGIALAPDAAQLYFNMAVTYRESLSQPDDARLALQKAVALEPLHPGAHVLLGQVFQSSGYTAPAFFALSTFLVIDPAGSQALPAYGLWRAVLKGGVETIPPAQGAPMRAPAAAAARKTDEGDFRTFENQLAPSFEAFSKKLDAGTPESQALVEQVDRLLGTLPATATGPAATSFVNRHYVPFFLALRAQGHVEPFVYWASQRAPVPGVVDWLKGNETRVRAFLEWASKYEWPAN